MFTLDGIFSLECKTKNMHENIVRYGRYKLGYMCKFYRHIAVSIMVCCINVNAASGFLFRKE